MLCHLSLEEKELGEDYIYRVSNKEKDRQRPQKMEHYIDVVTYFEEQPCIYPPYISYQNFGKNTFFTIDPYLHQLIKDFIEDDKRKNKSE